MKGINRALINQISNKVRRKLESISDDEVPCIFISYQREDEDYASEITDYIMSKQLDVYFDLEDKDLKFYKQTNNPKGITTSIQKGLNEADYMIVIISPDTYKSFWVPFEVGYAYDAMDNNLKLLRHKDIDKRTLPSYLKVKELLHGTESLNRFLDSIRKNHLVYDSLLEKGERIKTFSAYHSNPLSKYLDNE
jgi:hypothetical protein